MKVGRIDDPIWLEPAPVGPSPRRGARSHVTRAGLGLVVAAAGAVFFANHDAGPSACHAVTAKEFASALGWTSGPGSANTPESGGPTGTTVCNYGGHAMFATVFAVDRGATPFYEEQARVASGLRDVSGAGYLAFVLGDGGPGRLQAMFLVKNGEYVNVVLEGFPPGAAARLAPAVAANLP